MSYDNYMEQYNKIGYSKDGITHLKNFVHPKDIETFVNYLDSLDDDGTFKQEDVDHEIRALLIFYENAAMAEVLMHYGEKYGIPFKGYTRNPAHLTKWGMLTGSSMPVHSDSETPSGGPAIVERFYQYNITSLSYLTDDYSGGEISFPEFDLTIKPKAGDMLLFPSRYRHQILELKSGHRYTMPMFFQFDVEDTLEYVPSEEGKNPSDVLFFE